MKKSKIGNVSLMISENSSREYADSAENELLDLFKSGDPELNRQKILLSKPNWPLLYHLSYTREGLLAWYPFNSDGCLLEIGAGCGAITGLFCSKLKQVTALELSPLRAEVIAYRHKYAKNLKVIADNLISYKDSQKYDYVTSIGVLEYAKTFIDVKSPFCEFLKITKNFLKPGGKLILGIENRLGLKYWAGAKEDHTGNPFESIENYPYQKRIITFSKKELEKLLNDAGFRKFDFYFPFPDYKLPLEIVSDKIDSSAFKISPGVIPAIRDGDERDYYFNEYLAMDALIKNNLLAEFANSFLVIAE